MKRFVKWFGVPLVVIAGLMLFSPSEAEAGRWRRQARFYRAPYVQSYGAYWAAPPVAVRAYRPTVVYGPTYGYYGRPAYRSYYYGPHYYGW